MTKEKKNNPDNSRLSAENQKKHVKEAIQGILEKGSGDGFLVRTRKLFFGTIYCLSVAFFSCVFGLLAAVLLPILLPGAFIVGKIKGRNKFKEALS